MIRPGELPGRRHPGWRRITLLSMALLLAGIGFSPGSAAPPRTPPPSIAAVQSPKAFEHYALDTWQRAEGLPQETVLALAQTADGHLWIGTRAGLARFDGHHFEVFDRANTPALGSALMLALLADRQDRLWIGTSGGGLVRHVGGRFERFGTASFGNGHSLPDPQVSALLEDPADRLWVGTQGGLVILEEGRDALVLDATNGLPSPSVSALARTGDQTWVGTPRGLARVADDRIVAVVGTDEGLPDDRILALEPDVGTSSTGGGLWVGTGAGLARLDAGGRVLRTFDSRPVLSLARSPGGDLWLGTEGGGLRRLASAASTTDRGIEGWDTQRPESRQDVRSLLQGEDGDLWVGTGSDGLLLVRDGPFLTRGVRDGLQSKIVTAVIPARGGGVWLATRDAGVHQLDAEGRVVAIYDRQQGLETLGAWALAEDADGLWVGTDGSGLYRIENGHAFRDPRSEKLHGRVFALEPDGRGGIWLGTNGELAHLPPTSAEDGSERRPPPRLYGLRDGLPGTQVRALELDRLGRLWVGTVDGLAVLSGSTLEARRPSENRPLENVHAIHEDRHGVIWAASEGMGLARIEGSRFDLLDTSWGLFSNQVVSVQEDGEGHLWLGSSQGLGRIDARDLEQFSQDPSFVPPKEVYGRLDGLGGGGIWGGNQGIALGADGRVYFATREGLAEVDPSALGQGPTTEARIEWVEIRGLRRRPHRLHLPKGGNTLELPADVLEIRIHFAAPAPARGGTQDLRWRLRGYDRDWRHGPERVEKIYTHLPAGDYVFEIQASDRAGRFHGEPAHLALRVRPPFTRSPPFYGLVVLGFCLGLFGLHRWRLKRLEADRDELDRRVRAALDDLDVVRGLLPICGSCRKVRDDDGYWQQVEVYLHEHSEASFTHGLCPDCAEVYLAEIEDSKAFAD